MGHLSETTNDPISITSLTHGQQHLPPVPPKIRERIIKGEFIDFVTLLPKAMFSSRTEPDSATSFTVQLPSNSGDISVRPNTKPKRIMSFSIWMEAWNIYLAICIDHMPSRVPSLVAYQRIITSASIQSLLNPGSITICSFELLRHLILPYDGIFVMLTYGFNV